MPAGKPCPICGTAFEDRRYRPFCSKRCADIDLGRWLGEVYRIPVAADGDEDDADEATGFDPRDDADDEPER